MVLDAKAHRLGDNGGSIHYPETVFQIIHSSIRLLHTVTICAGEDSPFTQHLKTRCIRLSRSEERKLELLTAFGVNVERVEMSPSVWHDYYSGAMDKIRNNGNI